MIVNELLPCVVTITDSPIKDVLIIDALMNNCYDLVIGKYLHCNIIIVLK